MCRRLVAVIAFTLSFFPVSLRLRCSTSFFFNATAPTEIYTLSLHDALPISPEDSGLVPPDANTLACEAGVSKNRGKRSEEHTSELQSRFDLVCRLLLEKKNTTAGSIRRGTRRMTSRAG